MWAENEGENRVFSRTQSSFSKRDALAQEKVFGPLIRFPVIDCAKKSAPAFFCRCKQNRTTPPHTNSLLHHIYATQDKPRASGGVISLQLQPRSQAFPPLLLLLLIPPPPPSASQQPIWCSTRGLPHKAKMQRIKHGQGVPKPVYPPLSKRLGAGFATSDGKKRRAEHGPSFLRPFPS